MSVSSNTSVDYGSDDPDFLQPQERDLIWNSGQRVILQQVLGKRERSRSPAD